MVDDQDRSDIGGELSTKCAGSDHPRSRVAGPLTALTSCRPPQSLIPSTVGNYIRQPVSADRPDISTGVHCRSARSPLDARWNRVSGGASAATPAPSPHRFADTGVITKIEAGQQLHQLAGPLRRRPRPVSASPTLMAASETLGPRPCATARILAIAKRAMLRAAGVPDKDLYLVVLKDLSRLAITPCWSFAQRAGSWCSTRHDRIVDLGTTSRLQADADLRRRRPDLQPWLSPQRAAVT